MLQRDGLGIIIVQKILIIGLIALTMGILVVAMIRYGLFAGIAIAILPLALIGFLSILYSPFVSFVVLFVANYFVIAIMRYTQLSGLSVFIDVLIVLTLLSFALNRTFTKERYLIPQLSQNRINKGVIFASLIWAVYCCLEILNPSAMVSQWILSRGISLYLFFFAMLSLIVFNSFKKLEIIIFILSGLTLIGVAKTLMQQFWGFDFAEQIVLNDGLAKTHLLITGTRYFSIYASAGILGAIMGHAVIVFLIVAVYANSHLKRIYYIFVSTGALYALLVSGTRGSLVIPAAGLILFSILSKQIRLMFPTLVISVLIYVFLAMTTIGQSVYVIRRARTILDPNEPSLMVRLENQKKFAAYLANKPFGEGLGLSGVDVKGVPPRFTTSIPTDSWYVKIWVETGIVGLSLHIAILAYILLHGCYLIFFKLKNQYLKGILTGLHCGAFGILIASYGNQVLGQFPVVMIVYMSMALVFMGPFFDAQLENRRTVESVH
ncbi:MAG: O-antigen ligase family protein [Bacteroidales bacterium]